MHALEYESKRTRAYYFVCCFSSSYSFSGLRLLNMNVHLEKNKNAFQQRLAKIIKIQNCDSNPSEFCVNTTK